MLLRGWETGRAEEGQSATCTVRRCYGPSSSPSSDQATRSRHPEGSFSAAAGAAAAPHGCPQRRAGCWMQPGAAHGPRRPTPPVRPPQSALRLASPPPAGGGRRCEGGGGGVGPERGRRRGEDIAPRRRGRGETPATPGRAAPARGEGGGMRWPPSSSPNFPVLSVGR